MDLADDSWVPIGEFSCYVYGSEVSNVSTEASQLHRAAAPIYENVATKPEPLEAQTNDTLSQLLLPQKPSVRPYSKRFSHRTWAPAPHTVRIRRKLNGNLKRKFAGLRLADDQEKMRLRALVDELSGTTAKLKGLNGEWKRYHAMHSKAHGHWYRLTDIEMLIAHLHLVKEVDIIKLKVLVEKWTDDIDKLELSNQHWKSRNQILSGTIKEMEEVEKDAQEEIQRLGNELAHATNHAQHLTQQVGTLTTRLEEAHNDYSLLEKEYDSALDRVNELRQSQR